MGAIQAATPQVSPAGPRSPQRVLVLRALKLGDLLCAIPAFRALRAAWPSAEIVLLGLPWARALVDRYSRYLDSFREFPGYPGLPEQPPDIQRWQSVRAALRQEKFDLAIQMHGDGSIVNPLVAALGARRSAGFHPAAGPCPDPRTYLPWPTEGLEVHRLLALCALLGIPPRGDHLEWSVTQADRRALAALLGPRQPTRGRYVCVHPGASTPQRRWPLDCFAALANDLSTRGFTVVLTGTADERALTSALQRRIAGPVFDLAGRTDLGTLGALVAGARLVVCNDTGVSHLAAAVRTPSVVLSTGANPERWAPVDGRLHRVLRREDGGGAGAALRQLHDLLAAFRPQNARFLRPQRLARRLQCSRSGC
jgi:ADP-heptose:LPS heptosyltransferase